VIARSRTRIAGLLVATLVVASITALLYPLLELDPGVSSGVIYALNGVGLPDHDLTASRDDPSGQPSEVGVVVDDQYASCHVAGSWQPLPS
jgi:hypothetical protein